MQNCKTKMFKRTEAYLKAEYDVEKKLLSSTVVLSDGTQGKLFSRALRNPSDDIFVYHCHLCHVVNLTGEHNFKTHTNGRKHQKLLKGSIDAAKFIVPLFKDPKLTKEVNLGDPSGSNGKNLEPNAEFDKTLEFCDQPLVGLEYIVELRDLKSAPSFACNLCGVQGNQSFIMIHLVNHVHRVNYLQKHFPKILHSIWNTDEFQNNMTERDNVLEYTCHRLEVLIGMSEIKIRDFNTFQFKVKPIDDNVAIVSGKASIVSIESSDSELEFVQKKPQGKLEIKKTLENRSRSPPRWSNELNRKCTERPRQQSSELMKLRLVPNPMYKASKLSKERHDRDECRIRIERTLYELNQKYREYKLDPQLHPNYSEYWIAYWRRNRTAIKYANKSSIDIKKEWCKIFKPIMDKIHKAQIVCIKLEYKKKLKLSTKSCDKNKKRYEELTTRRQRSPVLISDDSEDYHRKPTKRSRVDPPIKGQVSKATCTITSGSLTDDVPDKDEETSPNEAFYGKYCPKLLAAKLQPFKPSEANDDDPITLKIVCRLFIDLDVNMGKLPSFMLMIFVQCLFLEIKEIRSIDEILLTNFNCWILNAVMHGLQNLIELNFMPKIKVAAAKRLIIKISILIQRGIIRALIDAQQPEHPILPTNPFECYDGTDYDNLDLSDKVTVGLASKGETKITKDDIANLINNFKKCRQLNDDEDDQVNPENDDEDYNEPEAKARDFTASTLPQVNLPELVNNDDKIANLIQQVRAQCAEHSLEKMTDNNLQQLTRKFKTLPEKIQNLLLSNKFEDFSKITALCKSINIEPVEIRIQQLTVAPEEIARSLNHAPLAHVHFDLAPDAFQVEELVQEIMQFENIAQVLLRDDDEEEVSGDDNSEVQIVENETPEPVEIIDDSDDDALEVEDTDDEAAEPIEILDSDDEISEIVKLDEEAFMVSDEELDDGSVENQYEQEVQGSDREQDSDTDMEEADSDSDSDQMDTDEENDSDMDGQDDRMDDDSDDEPAHEPTHEPEDEPDDDVDQEPAEEQPDVEEAEQPPAEDIDEQPPAGEQVDQAAGEQNPAPQAKEASKDSGGESDEDQPKESHRNYEYDSVDDGYDDAEVIAKMINLRTFEGPPKQPQSFEMPLPSTSAPPKSLLYSLQNNMRKAFNAPESSNDYCNRVCQLECNMETAKKLNYPYQNLTPIFRCKKPRFEEFNPNMFNNFNASIDSAQRHIALTKANDMYFHQLHSKDDNAQEPGIKRNKRR